MKISSSGIGTVATSQSCNAKAAYPYQWSWNAVGTDVTNTTGADIIKTADSDVVVSHQYGIKQSMESSPANNPGMKYRDEGGIPPGGNRSGPLNEVDVNKAKYIHLVVDLKSGNKTGWADIMLHPTTGFTRSWDGGNTLQDDWAHGVLIYDATGPASISGGVAITPHHLNSNTFILVWNAKDQIHKQGPAGGSWGSESDAPMASDEPSVLEFYPGGKGAFGFSPDNYLIIMGWVIADRILTDIPLPIRTHMG